MDPAKVPDEARLHFTTPDGSTVVLPFTQATFRIGRAENNNLVLTDAYVSRHHAEIVQGEEGFLFRDLQSTSGTFVNGYRTFEKILRSGDRITLSRTSGPTVVFSCGEDRTSPLRRREETEDKSEITASKTPAEGKYLMMAQEERAEEIDSRLFSRVQVLYRMTSGIIKLRPVDESLRSFLDLLTSVLDADRAAILLYDEKESKLRVRAYAGRDPSASTFEPSPSITSHAFQMNTAVLALDRSLPRAEQSGEHRHPSAIRSVACTPIGGSSRTWGVCYVDQVSTHRSFEDDDLEFLTAAAHQLGMGLDNLHLVEEQKKTFESFVRTLAASIDARDDITAGHSARVAKYSSSIAKYLGLSPHERRIVYYAGLLHDYGKIGTREAVLCKRGELTPDEYEHIKEHAMHTMKILSRIHFSAEMQDLPLIAASHHERMDGTGYPFGVAGEDIPLGARIIAVADFFDSLTHARHYREPVSVEEAVRELQALSGPHFDPKVVDAFLQFLNQEYLPSQQRRRAHNTRGHSKARTSAAGGRSANGRAG